MNNKTLYLGLLDLVANSEDDAFYFKDFNLDGITYRIFNYLLVNYTTFTTNPYAPYARGIMFEVDKEGNFERLACLPMNKFFNYAEGNVKHDAPNVKVLAIHEKLDGSLISSYMHKGELRLKSKGSLNSDQAVAALEYLKHPKNSILYSLVLSYTVNGFTVNMEWTSPNNRIVIGYSKDELRILNIRSIESHHLDLFDTRTNDNKSLYARTRTDKIEELGTKTLTQLVDEMYLEEEGEGYILTLQSLENDVYQVKVKNFKYCDLHHLKDSINSPKALFNLVIKGQTDDLVEAFTTDPLALQIIKEMEDKVIPKFNSTIKFVDKFYEDNKHLERKDYAILAKSTSGTYMPLVMNKYIGREVDYEAFAIKNMDYYLGE